MKKKFIYISMAAFLAITTFSACSNDVEESMPIPAEEEETVTNNNPYAITIDEAEKILEQFLANENEQVTKGGGVAHKRRIKNRYTTGGNKSVTRSANGDDVATEEPVLHIFNFENNEGFAVMGGDRRGAPMLALTERGEFTSGMTTDNLGMLFALANAKAAYVQMIIEAGSDTAVFSNGTVTTVVIKDSIMTNRNGQCPVNWGQRYPYNQYCPPYYSGNNNYPTGCVATAVAQLMAIHKYPSSFATYTLDWDAMIASPYCNDVAVLMMLLGLPGNLNMQYSPTGSGAYLSDAPRTLLNFGYTHPGSYADYSTTAVINDVVNGKPVLIGGEATEYDFVFNSLNVPVLVNTTRAGHAWLGDGGGIVSITMHVLNHVTGEYAVVGPAISQYVHCNFGWSGDGNGLYLSKQFDLPDNTQNNGNNYYYYDNNFQFNLSMVTGISK